MRDHHIKIGGRRWLLRFTRLKGSADGWTVYDEAAPQILIHDRLKAGQRVETLLHEIAHAVLGPTISEASVTELAQVQRRALAMLYTMQPKE